ncbi:MAG: hypothetical protein WBM86_25055 [Waterburya sp.]
MNYAQTITKENIVTKEDIQDQLNRFQSKSCYSEIGELLTFSLKNISSEHNRQLFGYIPNLFREIKIENSPAGISPSKLQIGEPVVYKISFPSDHTIKGIPFFYLFCYIKENSSRLNVYFQSAAKISNPLSQKQYSIAKKKITFEGVISAFTETESAICISDPGHFVPGLNSSFYVGTKHINFASLISNVVESICSAAGIELKDTFLFGSSAGAMGALLSSTYFSDKVQVLSVNSQIITYDLTKVMKTFLGTSDRHILLKKFADRVSCLNRFQQKINSVPNIYLLANVNDSLHQRNYKFYQLYQKLFTAKGRDNQSVFDSYYGVEGHGRPNKLALRKKIEMARETLRMESNLSNQVNNSSIQVNPYSSSFNNSHHNSSHSNLLESDCQMEKGYHQFSKSVKISRGNVDSEAISKLNQKEKLFLKKQSFKPEDSFPQLDYQAKYKSKLSQAEQESAADIFKIKSLNPKQHPEVGQISPDKSAIVGKQGWIYISSGTNHLMEYHIGQRRLPLLKINQWEQLLADRIKWHNSQKIKYQHIFIPNKIAVYPEYYPYHLDIKGNRPILQLQQKCRQLFTYPLDIFFRYKNYFRLYEKQDCHWSFWGCYFTYKLLCQKFEIAPNAELLDFPIEIVQEKGDLGGKFGLTEKTLQTNLKFNSRIIHDNRVINHCNQGSIRVLKNTSISYGKMIIFGDSFSNPGKPNYTSQNRLIARLSSLFAETLNEVHFVWTPWIDYDYIEQEKPDFVLTEIAERFLVRVPDDRDHLPLHEFAVMKIDQSKNKSK